MLGYWIVVSTQTPEEWDAIIDRKKSVLAERETSIGGIRWLEKLAEEGKAIELRPESIRTCPTDAVLTIDAWDQS